MAAPNSTTTANTTIPMSNFSIIETIKVNFGVVAGVLSVTTPEITFSGLVTGIQAGDVILSVSKPTNQAGLGIAGWRNDPLVADRFYVTYINPTGSTVMPTASEVYSVTVARMTQSNTTMSTLI